MFDSMASKYNMTLEDFNHFSNMAYEALSEPKMEWTYTVAMRFVFQAVTTIGYGFITPQTPEGQLLCIFVSLLGIPITVLAFQAIGELISRWVNKVVQKNRKENPQEGGDEKDAKKERGFASITHLDSYHSEWIRHDDSF